MRKMIPLIFGLLVSLGVQASKQDYLALASDALACDFNGTCAELNIPARLETIAGTTTSPEGFDLARLESDLVSIAKTKEDLPWKVPRSFSENVRLLLQGERADDASYNYLLEYMLMQYMARVRLEIFETAPEAAGQLISMDDYEVAELINAKFRGRIASEKMKLWDYLRLAISNGRDKYSAINSPIKPTPFLIYSFTRKLQASSLAPQQ